MKKSFRRKVQKIIDGDTFKIRNKINNSQYVRITGLNCPEKGQYGFHSAKKNLTKKIQGKTVTVKPKGKSYGRIVADVIHKRKRLRGKC